MTRVAQEIPKVGLVMESVKVVRWLKSVGDAVRVGDPLLEVETEKSVIEIEATVSGRLAQILLEVDQDAAVGDRCAWIDAEGTGDAAGALAGTAAATSPAAAMSPAPARSPAAGSATQDEAARTDRIRSSPAARKRAADEGLELRNIGGSGPRGRVQLGDVEHALEARADTASGRASPPPASVGARQPLTPMRRALARTMTLSNATVPQFIVERAVDWTTVQALRSGFQASPAAGPLKPSVNDFLLQAVARTLLEFPALNATFEGDPDSPASGILAAAGAHIGLALAVDDGLLVPVFHHVETLGLAEIARRRLDYVERGQKGRLKREELTQATFSISNLGAHGPDRFTAIINPPQSAILAVGRQRDCVAASDGRVVIRPMSALTLTVDHRIADGRVASDFIARLGAILEGGDWRWT